MIVALSFLQLFLCLVGVFGETYCPDAPTTPGDRRADTTKFRLAQFNTEWLFIDGYEGCPGDGCTWTDDEEAQKHLSAIASVIADINPDLINLAEVESCDELKFLIEDESLAGMGYEPYMIQGTDSSTGQDVGMLTRVDPQISLYRTENRVAYPIDSTTCNSTYTGTNGVSKHYVTTIKVNDIDIAVIGAHLLAFPDDQNRCVQREAQASVLADLVTPYMEDGYEVVVLGDFNDFDGVVIDRNDNVPISQVLSILKGQGQDWELTNAASVAAKEERYTDWWDEDENCVYELTEVSMIDHVLLSPGLVGRVTAFAVATNEYTQSCTDYYSDHFAVVVDFDFSS